MSKLLFWIGVILVTLVVMRIVARHASSRHHRPLQPKKRNAPKRYEAMVQCAHCGVHLPSTDALHYNGKTWCSQEHARLGQPK